jgi:hypothetical protein
VFVVAEVGNKPLVDISFTAHPGLLPVMVKNTSPILKLLQSPVTE